MGELITNSKPDSAINNLIFIKAVVNNLAQTVVPLHGYGQMLVDQAPPALHSLSQDLLRVSSRQQAIIGQVQDLLYLIEKCQQPHCSALNLATVFDQVTTNPAAYKLYRSQQLPAVLGDANILQAVFTVLARLSGNRPLRMHFRTRNGYLVVHIEGLARWLRTIAARSVLQYSDSVDQLIYSCAQAGVAQCGGQFHFVVRGSARQLYLRLKLSAQLQIDIQ